MTYGIDVMNVPGAIGDGVTDDTAAIQAAINTGSDIYLSKGRYRLTNALTFTTGAQRIMGAGRTASVFVVTTGFNLSAAGVLVVNGPMEPAPQFIDIGVELYQPDVSVASSLVQYPPILKADGTARGRIQRCRFTKGIVGVSLLGNTGGWQIDDLESANFGKNIRIDGALDTIRLNDVHIWPFGLTPNQSNIFFNDGNCVGVSTGKVDGLFLNGYMSICKTSFNAFAGATGDPMVFMSNFAMDSWSGLAVSAGTFRMSNGYFSITPTSSPYNASQYAVRASGSARVGIANCFFFMGQSTFPAVFTEGAGGVRLVVNNSHFQTNGADTSCVSVLGSGHTAIVSGSYFETVPHISQSNAVIYVQGGGNRLTATGNQCRDKGAGTGTFIKVAQDDFHRVVGNTAPGWANSFPAAGSAYYAGN
jgi:hypothetical protein